MQLRTPSPSLSPKIPSLRAADEDRYYGSHTGDFVNEWNGNETAWPTMDSESEDLDAYQDIDAESLVDAVDDQNASHDLPGHQSEDSSEDELASKLSKKRPRKAQTCGHQANKRTQYVKAKNTGLFHRRPRVEDDDIQSLEAGLGDLWRSYMHGDVFQDISNSKGRDNQPAFDAVHTTRAKAMQQMGRELSKASKKELKQLNNDIRDFCNRRCRARPDGRFSISGMLSTLEHYQVHGLVELHRREE